MHLTVLSPFSSPTYWREFTRKNMKAGKTEKTFNLEEKEKYCAQRENCVRWKNNPFRKDRL